VTGEGLAAHDGEHPVTAETTATIAPIEAATWTCGLVKRLIKV
jgi:hypothetical protein